MKFVKTPKTVGIIAGGFSGGQPKGGVEGGPSSLMEAGLVSQLEKLGWEVVVDPNTLLTYDHLKPAPSTHTMEELTSVPPPLKNVRYTSAVTKDVMKQVSETCSKGNLALTIGGDHSLAMGTISGSLSVYPNVGVLWVDAHADINTPETTTTGNLHGMPLSFLMGLASNEKFDEWLPSTKLHPSRLVYIGLRDVDPGEKELLKRFNIRAYSMHEVDKYGIGKIMDLALDYLGRDSPIHLSFDVDALDPSVCPSTGTPVRGGLTFREGHYINEVLAESGCLVAVDIMEVNPIIGDAVASATTIGVGLSLTRCALGERFVYSPEISNELTTTVFHRMKVADLKVFLNSLHISPSGNKPFLLAKFWCAFHKASLAYNTGNKAPLKMFANAIAKSGRIDVIQVLNLHTIRDIDGYQVTVFSPPPMHEYSLFSEAPLSDSSQLNTDPLDSTPTTTASQLDEDPLTRAANISPTTSVRSTNALAEVPAEQNTNAKLKSFPIMKFKQLNPAKVVPAAVLDIKRFSHYVFEKPPTFATIKTIKRHVVMDSSIMQSPIYFNLEKYDFDRLKKDCKIRVFIANIKTIDTVENGKEITIPVSLPKHLKTFINSTCIYQERYMILNNTVANAVVSADLTMFSKEFTNTFKISWTPSNADGFILISIELVEMLSIDQRVDQIIKKAIPEKKTNSLSKRDQDDELESTSEIITLRDPLSLTRIETPGHSIDCKHLQSFDLKIWFTLNVNSEQFICPVCNRYRSWSSLCFDEFYDKLLPQIPANIEKIQVFPDGKWEYVDTERRQSTILHAYEITDSTIRSEVEELVLKSFKEFNCTNNENLQEHLITKIEEWSKKRLDSTRKRKRTTYFQMRLLALPRLVMSIRSKTFVKRSTKAQQRFFKFREASIAEGKPAPVKRHVLENRFWKVVGDMKIYKPVTPGLANRRHPTRFHLHPGRPVLRLSFGKRSTGGRNCSGRITVRHRGGGHKRRVRIIDFHRNIPGPHTVVRLEYDPNRSAELALLRNQSSNELSYIIRPATVNPGDVIYSWRDGLSPEEDQTIPKNVLLQPGNCLQLADIPVGSVIHNISLTKEGKAIICRSAGTSAQVLSKSTAGFAQIKLVSKEVRLIPLSACATMGSVGNEAHKLTNLGKAGASRRRGIRPTVRGIAMNAHDHPHGGGKKSKGGKAPRSPWGWKTKGVKSVKRKKWYVITPKWKVKLASR